MKRLISLLISLLFVLTLVPFSAFSVGAETYTDSQGVTYTLSDDETYYIVSDCDESATSIVIPETYNDLPVEEIGYMAFSRCECLTSIQIPNSVTSIGDYAFNNCYNLTSIEIPETAVLGYNILEYCAKIPFTEYENIKYFGTKDNPYQIVYDTVHSSETYTLHPNAKQISSGVFQYNYTLTSIEIPNSITIIGDAAFSSCMSLTSIEIPHSVTSIGDSTFAYCSSLTSIEIPNSVTSIGNSAFSGCSSLASIEIPNSITSIGKGAFSGCESLTSIEIPNSIASIGAATFSGCKNLTDIYCEAESQPEGWSDGYFDRAAGWICGWNEDCPATVHWGAKMSGSVEEPETGDINGNGTIDSMDYLYLKRAFFKQYSLSDISIGDINKNGEIDSMDYLYLKRAFFKQYVIA